MVDLVDGAARLGLLPCRFFLSNDDGVPILAFHLVQSLLQRTGNVFASLRSRYDDGINDAVPNISTLIETRFLRLCSSSISKTLPFRDALENHSVYS